MSAIVTFPRRAALGFLGFAGPAAIALPEDGSPDARLALCLLGLQEADRELEALPDDHPLSAGLVARMDTILGDAAMIRPKTDRGFAIKARIARVYGDCVAGELVQRWLLSDLMIRGRA